MNLLRWLVALVALLLLGLGAFWALSGDRGARGLEPVAPDAVAAEERTPTELARPADRPAEPELEPRPARRDEDDPGRVPRDPRASVRDVDREAVPGPVRQRVEGTVFDEVSGTPAVGFDVALDREGVLFDLAVTDAEGRFVFELTEWAPDEDWGVTVEPLPGFVVRESRARLAELHVSGNFPLAFHVKPWPPEVAGDISGWLRTESGGFPAEALPRANHLVLDLVSTEQPPITRRGALEATENARGELYYTFRFEDVPAGEYNLTLSSLGNYRWEPTSVLVSPPREGIEFLRYDLDEVLPLAFEVFDAESEEPVTDFEARHIKQTNSDEHGVFLHTGPIEGEQFPRDMPFRWSVEADGYAVAYGDERAFVEEDGRRVAKVYLKRGWSTRFLVMGGKPRTAPLDGAEVWIDGSFVGSTGPDGGLDVALAEAPGSVDVRYGDWTLAEEIALFKRRSNVTPVLMTAPE